MRFDLDAISDDLSELPVEPLPSFELAVAIINDVFRLADRAPVDESLWEDWRRGRSARWKSQMQVLARFLICSRLREQSVACLKARSDRRDELGAFFDTIKPITAAMLLENRFRREELLRRFIEWCEGRIQGENKRQSTQRLKQLDYRKTLLEFQRAEAARHDEEETRLRLLREAREREEASRGWRE